MSYLDPTIASQRLIDIGDFDTQTVPSIDILTNAIVEIELKIDAWLGVHLALGERTEQVTTSHQGIAVLSSYPVHQINEAVILLPEQPPQALTTNDILSYWQGRNSLYTHWCYVEMRINYLAGYDPVPPIFGIQVFKMLREGLQRNPTLPDFDFLEEPTRDTSSLSIPGGVSKSFQLGKSKSEDKSTIGGSELERYLKPLIRYRRRIIF